MMFVWLLCWLSVRIAQAHATNHWMVTETGLLQPRDDSPFLMENPFDLLSFLNQHTRWENIFNIYHNLIHQQKNINRLWVKLEAVGNFDAHIAENEFCVKAGNIGLVDWYTSFLEDGKFKGIPDKEFALQRLEYGDSEIPDCKKISSLTFSMFAFEHLNSMMNREHLNATPEFALPELFAPIMTVDQFGHWLSNVLRKNSSSWLHYNLAAIYWRVQGKVPKALECSRRAVHYAPRQFKSIALLCLGSILHRSRHSDDATVVLGAAVDHDPEFPISHFALGGALAVTGDFNSSLKHLDLSMKLHSQFDLAKKFRNGVLCHLDMFKKIKTAQSTLKELSQALEKYTETEIQWLKIQTAFLKTMKHKEEYDYKDIDRNCAKMDEITGLKIKALQRDGDRNSLVLYFIDSPTFNVEWSKETGVSALDTAQSLQRIIIHIGSSAGLPTKNTFAVDETRNKTEVLTEIGPMPSFPDMFPNPKRHKPRIKTEFRIKDPNNDIKPAKIKMGSLQPDTGKLLYPSNFKVNRNKEIFDTDPDWPSDRFCKDSAPKFPENIELIYPVFLPFENKGIKLNYLLTERIGVPAFVEHELPWHPPICPADKDLTLYTQRKGLKIQIVSENIGTEILRRQLLRYLSDSHLEILKEMQDAEIGQRIQTAIEKKMASKWVLFTIASLYWRVRGNIPYALNCLLTAGRTVDTRYRDVVLVSLASVFMEMGLLDECSNHAEEAYKISPYEPATNFVLAQLSMIKKNQKAHMFHLKQALRVEGRFMGNTARHILNGWACILKQVNTLKELGVFDESEICAEVDPGVSMVCERDGTNCHISNRNCDSGRKRETSQIVRMLELKDDTIQGAPVVHMTDAIFDKFIDAMPLDRTNKVAHQKNYDFMMKTVHRMLKGCGTRGCVQIEPEDLALEQQDCVFNHLHTLDYWLHIISYRQQMSDADVKLPADIIAMPSFPKKVPVCRLPAAWPNDFYLERMMKVDSDGWEPLQDVMQELAELFSFYDYSELGSKIARYVEIKPTSFLGLIAAGWWCGAKGRGACACRCLVAAHASSPIRYRPYSLRSLAALLLLHSKTVDGKDIAYLSFYASPKSKEEAFLVAVSHTYRSEYEQAVWMYRYALTLDGNFLPAKACLHISMCNLFSGENFLKKNMSELPS